MKKNVLFWTALSLISFSASAQTATTLESVAPQAQTSVTGLAPATEATTPKYQMSLGSENFQSGADARALGNDAPIVSANAVGLVYNVNTEWALELRQYMVFASNRDNLTGRSRQGQQNAWEQGPTMLRVAHKPTFALFGSKALALEGRYYLPNDRAAKENKENGFLRADATAEWALTPKYSVGGYFSPRARLNSSQNPNEAVGSDAAFYQLKLGPSATYYMNDNFNAYYSYTIDAQSTQAQRGTFEADAYNTGMHEIGANWVVGPVTINPALDSEISLANGESNPLGSESRFFSYETLTYNLNFYATF